MNEKSLEATNVMDSLDNLTLIETYHKARQMQLENEFVAILLAEINKRKLILETSDDEKELSSTMT